MKIMKDIELQIAEQLYHGEEEAVAAPFRDSWEIPVPAPIA